MGPIFGRSSSPSKSKRALDRNYRHIVASRTIQKLYEKKELYTQKIESEAPATALRATVSSTCGNSRIQTNQQQQKRTRKRKRTPNKKNVILLKIL